MVSGLPEKILMPDGNEYIEVKSQIGMNGFQLLNVKTGEYYRHGKMNRKLKKRYMRIKSGSRLAFGRGERLDFLTLTTAYDKSEPGKRLSRVRGLNYAFTLLKQRMEYWFQKKQYLDFCKKQRLKPYVHVGKGRLKVAYWWAWEMFRFKFRYFKVKTSEGGGVLHIIFRKGYNVPPIPKKWLKKQWFSIWGAYEVKINEVSASDQDKMHNYLVNSYFIRQPVIRMSYGHQWVCVGFVKKFKAMIGVYGFRRALELWNKRLDNGEIPVNSRQRSIFGRVGKDNKWHGRRYIKPESDRRGVLGCEFNVKWVKYYFSEGYRHLKWWDCRLDSPKWVSGYYFALDSGRLVWYSNTVFVA